MKIGKKELRLRIRKENLPNTLPLLRCILAITVMTALLSGRNTIGMSLFFLTGILAFFDGFLSRRRLAVHQLWTILDPLADKLLINLAAIALYINQSLPLYAVIVFIAKDLAMVFGGGIILYKDRHKMFRMNYLDKLTTLSQFITMLVLMVHELDYVLLWASISLAAITFVVSAFKSPFQIIKKEESFKEYRFRYLFKLADIFTLSGVVFGFLAIVFSMNDYMNTAAILMLCAVAMDYIDGKVARATRREGDFGKELDSLADTVSFGVAPAVFAFSLFQNNLAIIAYTIFIFAGILRLARYNIMDSNNGYAGMPITMNGIIIPLVYFSQVPVLYYPYIYIILAVLMISTLKIRKMI